MSIRPTLVDYFSVDYFAARRRFVEACTANRARHFALPLTAASPTSELLTIDVVVLGSPSPRKALVVSSGVHGVEAPLGAAIQLAYLDRLTAKQPLPADFSVVMLHAVNPYGFAWQRRFNEENVDLNRNFLLPGESYDGAPVLAAPFRRVLGPTTTPSRFGVSNLRLGYLAARHGTRAFWTTLPVGQYELSDWLFYGGKRLSQSGALLQKHLPKWIGSAGEVVHLDIHTGLGKWARCELLLSERERSEEAKWWLSTFPDDPVVEGDSASRYLVRGGFGPWLQSLLPNCDYHYATAEFGTYSPMRAIRSLADESRWNSLVPALPPRHWSRRRLSETFAPASVQWRKRTLETGVRLTDHAERYLTSTRA